MNRLTLTLCSALLLAGCGKPAEAPEPVRPVLSLVVEPQSQANLGRFAGSIQARYESTLGFRVGGRIARRWVDVGSSVKPGDVLASLDPTDQRNQLRAAEGDLAKVQAQWINAQANARRQQQLFDRGVGAQAQLDIAQTDLKTTGASLEQARAAVEQARDQLGYSELKADHAAVVTNWQAEAGQTVSAGQAVVTLARPDIKEAVIDLPTSLAEQVSGELKFLAASQLDSSISTTATLRELEPQADAATRTRRARLTLADTPLAFHLGTAISVTLTSAVSPRVELPASALLESEAKTRVWIVDPQQKTVSTREVKLLERTTNSVVLASGVQAGERVVTAGVNSLKPGQKVIVDEEDPK
ncbi:efflux RND transporter periplasmic adaptor subunit [Pseudomonas donghuensis]|uniref:efflux RND transporter periplasmic adaptor subunit n=1 Tax=Pseudomonas donghuensis TaxID=1163398 RepID=UPI0020C32414|nr:efflux RND transporter periplasmic adaptor subunit [Pseudomonas donghuensis]MBF4209589.1 efflux RND transporter periplasmic adaptor subunit [Pseudomonas donghuensis]MCP6697267.1 efflux RND transporter periplasmic adaptor subunit [Pseudomonas donghuensis]UVL24182.1 efflux RND transporter periplasmic adaptor subunit [Pseudomonas donghuensis]UVL29302.1 efflux RND transporter periplasmic adaptor subunit [Pseudomonas donghuensis]